MRSDRTVALCGVSEADRIVFASLLNIISFKTSERWVLVEGAKSEVVVVNVDSHSGQAFLQRGQSEAVIIELAVENLPPNGQSLCLRRPLRARDILTCLESVSRRWSMDEDWKMAQGRF